MKFSVALSLCMAPLVLAKSVRNIYPARRDIRKSNGNNNNNNGKNNGKGSNNNAGTLAAAEAAALAAAEVGLVLGSLSQVIVIWVNGGGGAATTTVNSVQTVTQTVTAGGAGTAATATAVAAGTTVTGSTGGTGTTVASGAGATHTVIVGGDKGLIYEPSSIQAAVGDMVVFTFLSKNHTVSQSSFAAPCELLAGGMDSGFQPNVNNSVNPPPQVALQVMVSTPLWFYCRQKAHCGLGMVFSINPTANKTQAMFQQMAIAQNGTGTGSAITGGTTSAAAVVGGTTSAAAAGAGSVAASSVAAAPGTVVASSAAAADTPAASNAAAAASSIPTDSTAGTGLTTGTGTVNPDGSCACAVVCNANAFPAVQAQGIGAFGGFGGSVPMSALPAFSAR